MEDKERTILEDIRREFRSVRDLRGLQKVVQKARLLPEGSEAAPSGYRARTVSILSNYSTQFVASALRLALIERGIWPSVCDAGYNQWEWAARNPAHPVFTCHPDFVLLLLSSLDLAYSPNNSPAEIAGRIVQAIQAIRSHSKARVFLTLPEPLEEELSVASWARPWRSALSDALRAGVGLDVTLIDLAFLISKTGAGDWYSARHYATAKLAFHPDQTAAFASHIANLVRGTISLQCKLVIVDLDNSLWGGEVGEVGWQQVDLDATGKGLGYLRFQRFLKGLHDRGVLLAIASKNSPEAVHAVFVGRPEMVLKGTDFAAKEISWDPKSHGIRRILDQLNLSTSGVMFLDDSLFERGEVKNALPELIVPDLPQDVIEWVPRLIDTGLFERPEVTAEDIERKTFYEQEHTRQRLAGQVDDYDSFLRSAEMKLYPEEILGNDERFLDLINKTNQFNMTNRRHGWSSIEKMLGAGGLACRFRAEDRFGAYGAISSIILVPDGDRSYRIETWVMSCRAMGRTVENAILQYVMNLLKTKGAQRLVGEFIESGKNGPARSVFETLGFRQIETRGESTLWDKPLDDKFINGLNKYIEILPAVPKTPA